MLAAAVRRDAGNRAFYDLEQSLLDAFARNIARDGDIFGLAGDLVDLVDVDDAAFCLGEVAVSRLDQREEDVLDVVADIAGLGQGGGVGDGERHVKEAGDCPREERLAAAGGADEKNVALFKFDIGVFRIARAACDAAVVVVNGDGKGFLGVFLPDDVGIEKLLDVARNRDLQLFEKGVQAALLGIARFRPFGKRREGEAQHFSAVLHAWLANIVDGTMNDADAIVGGRTAKSAHVVHVLVVKRL